MERVFSGKKVEYDQIVKIEQNGSVALLPLEPSLEIADHSPDGFNWGYDGSGSAQLALGILYEVTRDGGVGAKLLPDVQVGSCFPMGGAF